LGLSRSYQEISDRAAACMIVFDTKEFLADVPNGVTEAPLKEDFEHRYRGFRLVLESGGRAFLALATWSGDSRTVALPYDGSVRLQDNTHRQEDSGRDKQTRPIRGRCLLGGVGHATE
jgi:hypothetical protein